MPSLAELADCTFEATPGAYNGLQLLIDSNYQVLISDTADGLYTDPASSTLLSTTPPAGGAQLVSFTQGGPGTSSAFTYFTSPVTVTESGVVDDASIATVELAVLFDPSYWLGTRANGGALVQPLSTNGNPPIYGTLEKPAKAVLLDVYNTSNEHSAGSIHTTDPGMLSYVKLVFADDAQRAPLAVTGPQHLPEGNGGGPGAGWICPTLPFFQAWPGSPDDCPKDRKNGACYGVAGYLGVTPSGVVSWAFSSDDFAYQTYSAVLSMQLPTTVGASTTVNYVCSSTAPAPANGAKTYTTAPDLSALGTVRTIANMTLVAN